MKQVIAYLVFISVFLCAAGSVKAADKEVAKVGDAIITALELDEALQSYVPPGVYHAGMDPSKKEKFKKDALNDLIEQELLYREAVNRGLKVPDDLVEKVVKENIDKFGSEKKLEAVLKNMGLTMDSYKRKIEKRQMVVLILNEISKDSEYSDEELKKYYEENKAKFKKPEGIHLWEIMIKVDPVATDEEIKKKKEQAEEILGKIRSGEDFGIVAYNFSEDPYRFKSGDLGFVHRGQLDPKELEDAAFALKEGEVSGIVHTLYGFQILKAGERKPAEQMSFDDMKGRLKKEFYEKRFKENKAALIEKLRKQYPVEIYIKTEDKDVTGQPVEKKADQNK